jgi:hypothetical protein
VALIDDDKDEDLPDEASPEVFPWNVFPVRLQEILKKYAASIHCPVDFLAVPLLVTAGTAIGTAIGTARAVEVKPGWIEMARIWAAIVADPGSRKSPALSVVVRPFEERNRKLFDDFFSRQESFEHELAEYEIELTSWKRSLQRGEAVPDDRPVEPDPTTAGAGHHDGQHPRGAWRSPAEKPAWDSLLSRRACRLGTLDGSVPWSWRRSSDLAFVLEWGAGDCQSEVESGADHD